MRRSHQLVPAVLGHHVHDQAVIETETAQQHVGSRHLEYLSRRQGFEYVRHFLAHSEAEHCCSLVTFDHLLGKQHISQVRLTNFFHQFFGIHDISLY